MAVAVLMALFSLTLFAPKSKLLYYAMIIYMWVLFVFNTGAPDTSTYEWIYNDNVPGAFEPIFTTIMTVCRYFHLPFVGFRIVVATLMLTFLNRSFRLIEDYKTLALAFYMISPFPWQVSGMRSALACTVLMYAMSVLIEEPRNKKKYCFWLLMATLIHYSSILFVIMLLARHEFTKKNVLPYIGIAVMGILVVTRSNILFDFVSIFTQREKIITWLSGGVDKQGYPNIKGFIAELIILFGNIFLTWRSKTVVMRYILEVRKARVAMGIYNINVISILFIPLLRLNDTSMRLLFVIHSVNTILYAMAIYVLQEQGGIESKKWWVLKPRTCLSRFVVMAALWTFIIAIYQNLPYFGSSYSVIKFLEINSTLY